MIAKKKGWREWGEGGEGEGGGGWRGEGDGARTEEEHIDKKRNSLTTPVKIVRHGLSPNDAPASVTLYVRHLGMLRNIRELVYSASRPHGQ